MKTAKSTTKAFASLLKNKAIALALLAAAVHVYLQMPADSATPVPFVELYYVGINLGAAVIVAPFLRLIMFPEAAEYAESGTLRRELMLYRSPVSPAMLHYWFATAICNVASILCFTSLLNLK
jgi:hypothetical protein